MANISKRDRTREKRSELAAKNRREIIAAGLSRREMLKMGLLTTAGLLVPMSGLSVRARNSAGHFYDSGPGSGLSSPPTTPFSQAFTRMTVKQPVASLNPRYVGYYGADAGRHAVTPPARPAPALAAAP